MGDISNWIAFAALGVSVLVGVLGVFVKRPFVAATIADELRAEIFELRGRIDLADKLVAELKMQLSIVMTDREWWRYEYQKLRDQESRRLGLLD
jgi:hypothetical protein